MIGGAEDHYFSLKKSSDECDNKYKLNSVPIITKNNSYGVLYERPSPLSFCTNEDFESSLVGTITASNQIAGWSITAGLNDPVVFPGVNSCNLLGCCPLQPSQSEIIDCSSANGYLDYNIGSQYPIYSIFGTGTVTGASSTNPHILNGMFGNKVIRLNNGINDYSVERLSKTFFVTATDTLFGFAFLPVLSTSHQCCDAAGIQINISNSSGIISSYSFSPPSSICSNTQSCDPYLNAGNGTTYDPNVNFDYVYHKWIKKTINLKQFVGQSITLEVIATDCNAGGHFGYTYFDAQCGDVPEQNPFKVFFDGAIITNTDSVVNIVSCSSFPVMYSEYPTNEWSGPTFSNLAINYISINTPGSFTLNASYTVGCNVISVKKVYNISFFKGVEIVSSDSIICLGESVTLSSNGKPIFHWNTGDTTRTIIVSPVVDSQYKLISIDSTGCLATSFFTQKVEQCTYINSFKTDAAIILIYPNPSTGVFILQLNKELLKSELIIESTFGQILYRQEISFGKNEIKAKELASGIYYYKIITNNLIVAKGKFKVE